MNDDAHTITITELPVGTWTKDYKAFLDELLTAEEGNPYGLKNFDDLYNDIDVKFILYFTEDGYDNAQHAPHEFEKAFKLTSSWKTTNMCCFDAQFTIQKYATIGDILEAFVETRLPFYEVRRQMMLKNIQKEVVELDAKVAFLRAVIDGRLELVRKSDEEIVAGLKACGIPALSIPEEADKVDGYEYVLRLRIDRVKAAAIADLEAEVADKKSTMSRLEKETPASMWLTELEEFKGAWAKYSAQRTADTEVRCTDDGEAKSGKKKRVLKTKKQ
jgi:DNA topoisomerase-2